MTTPWTPKDNLEGSQDIVHHDYAHIDIPPKVPEDMEKLEYIYQHFQDHEKVYESDPQVTTEPIHDTLYPQMNNDIEYGLLKNIIDCYYLDSQIRDNIARPKYPNPPCTYTYDHISQLNSLANIEQQQTLYTNKSDASLFTTDTATPCTFNIVPSDSDTDSLL